MFKHNTVKVSIVCQNLLLCYKSQVN